jgi:hypothetical protein
MTATLPAQGPRPRYPSIISPWVDTLAIGGLSLVAFIPLLLSGREDLVIVSAGTQAWIAALVNMPHFLASYRMVYRTKDMILRHKWASIWIPAILLLYICVAIYQAQYTPALVSLLLVVSSSYLAWHYTGQIWGMMATYAHLDGLPFIPAERHLIRGGLRILLTWHVVWFLYSSGLASDFGINLTPLYTFMTWTTLVALVLGAVGMSMMKRRTGHLPPARAIVAWAAIFVWYAAMARDPRAIFWVQIAHALQYLIFPFRVELNITERKDPVRSHVWRHMVLFVVIMLAVSWFMSHQLPATAMTIIADTLGERPGQMTPMMILAFLNIHHYFTDGVIWKIRNPEVQRDLFAHVPKPVQAGATPARA